MTFEDSDKDSSDNKQKTSRKNFIQFHKNCCYSIDECTTLMALIKKAKFNKSKGYKK